MVFGCFKSEVRRGSVSQARENKFECHAHLIQKASTNASEADTPVEAKSETNTPSLGESEKEKKKVSKVHGVAVSVGEETGAQPLAKSWSFFKKNEDDVSQVEGSALIAVAGDASTVDCGAEDKSIGSGNWTCPGTFVSQFFPRTLPSVPGFSIKLATGLALGACAVAVSTGYGCEAVANQVASESIARSFF